MDWKDILNAQCFVLNMDKCSDRLALCMERIQKAGFTNVTRYRGLNAELDDLQSEWLKHGQPKFNPSDPEFVSYPGKQACALGHYGIWKHICDNDIDVAVVFEDDVEFHKDWQSLAPAYWASTPKDFDILYLGAQIEADVSGRHIAIAPVFCTHAYVITKTGAKKLYELCLRDQEGTRTIDCMLITHMHKALQTNGRSTSFTWYVWNASQFPDVARTKRADWAKRNSGLVFQDADLGTFVRPW